MSQRATLLAARRELLLARSAYLRTDLRYESLQVSRRLQVVDAAVGFARSRGGRVLLSAGALLLLLAGPRKLVRAAGRLAAVWPVVRPWLRRIEV